MRSIDKEIEIDHEYTNEIVCPHCGYEHSDSWEHSPSDEELGLLECSECEKEFYATRNITITYSTEIARYGTCKGCNENDVVVEDHWSSFGKYTDLCVKCGAKEKDRLLKAYVEMLDKKSIESTALPSEAAAVKESLRRNKP